MKKRLFIGFLCVLLALATLLCAGCKGDGKENSTTGGQVNNGNQPSDNDSYAHLPTTKLDREYVILTDFGYPEGGVLLAEDYDGDPLNDVYYERTAYMQERFGATLMLADGAGQASQKVQQSHLGGGQEYDLVFPHPQVGIMSLMTSGTIANLHDLSLLSLDEQWYNQSQVQNYTSNGKLYIATSDYSMTSQAFMGFAFNTAVYDNLELTDDLYQLVDNKQWTVEKLAQIVKDVTIDTAGTGDAGYALVYRENFSHSMMYAMGGTILNKDANGNFTLGLTTNMLSTMETVLSDLVSTNTIHEACSNGALEGSKIWAAFKAGKSLFMTIDFGSQYTMLRDLPFDIGYLPPPTMNAGDDYRIFCGAAFFAIPTLAKNINESAAIFEALSIYSFEHVRPVFFDSILLGRLSEKPEDYRMLEFMHNNKYFDLGFTIDQGVAGSPASNALYQLVFTEAEAGFYFMGNKQLFNEMVNQANNME